VKKEGKTPVASKSIVDARKFELRGQGNSVRIIAAQLGLTKSTVHSIVVA
jgi:DNA-binding NarL/FixJ family response regulator